MSVSRRQKRQQQQQQQRQQRQQRQQQQQQHCPGNCASHLHNRTHGTQSGTHGRERRAQRETLW